MKKYLCFMVIVVTVFSCKDVIDIDVPHAGKRLVIEASIDWEKGTEGNQQVIKLSTSTPYFDKKKDASVKGALVSVTDDNTEELFKFYGLKNGLYITQQFKPILGHSYTLSVDYKGKKYSAKETLKSITALDSISQDKESFFGGETTKLQLFFKDPKDIKNYYLSYFDYKNKPVLNLINDEFSDGNVNNISYRNNELEVGDTIDIKLYGVSKYYFNYIRILNSQIGGESGAPFQAPPAKVYGNCKNVNDSEEEVLGYFRVSEYVKSRYIIEEF